MSAGVGQFPGSRPKTSMHHWRLVVVLLLALNGAFLAFFCVPDLMNARLFGLSGHYHDGRFTVVAVYRGGPAESAGLRAGDAIVSLAGSSISDWYADYRANKSLYHSRREEIGASTPYVVARSPRYATLLVTPRPLALTDIVRLYGVRLLLITLLVLLTIVILNSKTRERAAALIMLTFSCASLWLVLDIPERWEFLARVASNSSEGWIQVQKILEIVSLQLAIAFLLHVVLVFPRRHRLLERFPRLLLVTYLGPGVILIGIMLASSGGVLERLAAVNASRLWLNTVAMIAAAALMWTNYRSLPSPEDRVKVRWIVGSLVLLVAINVVLWNLPKLLTGYPLAPNYEWVLLPMTLVPITMTMSILNHELFGIRGLIRGRILLLEKLLERERSLVVSRDHRIREMTGEIAELDKVLEQYRRVEQGEPDAGQASSLSRLEQRYPALREIRHERLLGVSPKWERIFERAVVAARGAAPVMLVGESGTGKTDLAWTVHRLGDRRDKVYKEISCAQFEHADPAFALGRLFGIGTGHGLANAPKEGRAGLLQECDGGTLFLDDVDRLPLSVQDMLLYPLEGRAFEPGVGAGPARSVSIKFILATNRNPDRLVADGHFRGDVLARVGERIDIPPLRERPEDIPILVRHFIDTVCQELGHEIIVVSPKAMNLLAGCPYAGGNARELRAELRAAVGKAMLEDDKVLRAGYLSERLGREDSGSAGERSPFAVGAATQPWMEPAATLAVLKKHRFQIKAAETELGYSHKSRTLSNHLRGLCIRALSENGWDPKSAAISLAGASETALAAKLQGKIDRYVKNVQTNVARGTEVRLYRNLPASYREALGRMIAHLRNASAA